jgi:hypothetical protein
MIAVPTKQGRIIVDLNQIIEAGLLKNVFAVGAVFFVVALGYMAILIQQSAQKRVE